jgi:hypothetical protein
MMKTSLARRSLFPALLVVLCLLTSTAVAQAAELLTWKLVPDALLKIDGRPVKLWNIYTAKKKPQYVLVQLGSRYLLLETQVKEVHELKLENIQHKGKELNAPLPQESDKPLPTADWVVRSVGPALLVRVKLAAEGRVLEVQLPQKPDLRSLY